MIIGRKRYYYALITCKSRRITRTHTHMLVHTLFLFQCFVFFFFSVLFTICFHYTTNPFPHKKYAGWFNEKSGGGVRRRDYTKIRVGTFADKRMHKGSGGGFIRGNSSFSLHKHFIQPSILSKLLFYIHTHTHARIWLPVRRIPDTKPVCLRRRSLSLFNLTVFSDQIKPLTFPWSLF